ncbi:MAG: 6-carboxytetrahydropterin synthase [Aureisphaera sp.]
MYKTAIVRREHFNAAHRLHNKNWTDKQNRVVFGKCNNPNYHGHNYELEVKVIGVCDPETGYVMDTKVLSTLIKERILDKFDHKNLNLDTIEFVDLNPTSENIARVIYDLLRADLDASLDLKIKLYETPRNFVEYPY